MQALRGSYQVERELRPYSRVVGTRSGQSHRRHVAIADRLYLFAADIISELIEFTEQAI